MEDLKVAISYDPIDVGHQLALAKLQEDSKDFSGALQRYQNILFWNPSEEKCKTKIKELMEAHQLPPPRGRFSLQCA